MRALNILVVVSIFTLLILNLFSISISADTTPPQIKDVATIPSSIIQGEELTIKCNVTDNVAVNVVKAIIKYPDNSTVNMTMKKGEGNEYYYTAKYTIVGTYTYHIWANDTSGNANITANETFVVKKDIYPPTTRCYIYGDEGNNDWYVGEVKIVLQANDTGMDHVNIYYKLDSQPWCLYLDNFFVSDDGIHDLYYYSIDIMGNKEETNHMVFKMDKTSPTTACQIAGYKGNDGWYLTNVTVTLAASDVVSGINRTYYRINNQSWQEYMQPFNLTENGIYTLHYYSVDNAGNIEEEKIKTIKIDKSKPVVKIIKPLQGYLYIENRQIMPTLFGNTIIFGKITIVADASNHESGIQKVEFYIDGVLQDTITQPPYEWQWDYMAIGTHLIKVIAYDNAGNYDSQEMVVKIFNI